MLPPIITKTCKHHGTTDFVKETDRYRCRKCRSEAVTRRRKKLKQKLVEHFGGACTECGYDACVQALEFHHPEDDKEFGIASKGMTYAYSRMLEEASKCVLLCCRCHREVHAGLRKIPPPSTGDGII